MCITVQAWRDFRHRLQVKQCQTCGGMVNMNGMRRLISCMHHLADFTFPLLISMMVFTMAAHGNPFFPHASCRKTGAFPIWKKASYTIFNTPEVFATCRRCLQNSHNTHVSSVKIFLDCTRPKSGPEIAWKKNYPTGHTVAGCLLAAKFCDARAHTHSIVTQWKQPSTHKHT